MSDLEDIGSQPGAGAALPGDEVPINQGGLLRKVTLRQLISLARGVQGEPGPAGDASAAWPIGSVFIAVVGTDPATLLGFGTWIPFAAGRVMVGIDPTQTEFDVVGETGGAKTHTLTASEVP